MAFRTVAGCRSCRRDCDLIPGDDGCVTIRPGADWRTDWRGWRHSGLDRLEGLAWYREGVDLTRWPRQLGFRRHPGDPGGAAGPVGRHAVWICDGQHAALVLDLPGSSGREPGFSPALFGFRGGRLPQPESLALRRRSLVRLRPDRRAVHAAQLWRLAAKPVSPARIGCCAARDPAGGAIRVGAVRWLAPCRLGQWWRCSAQERSSLDSGVYLELGRVLTRQNGDPERHRHVAG